VLRRAPREAAFGCAVAGGPRPARWSRGALKPRRAEALAVVGAG